VSANFFSIDSLKKPSGIHLLLFLIGLLFLLAVGISFWGEKGAGLQGLLAYLLFPLIICAVLSAGLGYWVVPLLLQFKASQIIQEDGPQAHLKKVGTPTMGGIFFLPISLAIAVIGSGFDGNVVAVGLATLGYLAIGWYDDWQILRQQSNKGIAPKTKLFLQIIVAVLFCLWVLLTQPASITTVQLFANLALPLGFLFWLVAVFALVAESNATNLTDGVDGLAAGTCALAFLGMGGLTLTTFPALTFFCACLSGGCLGFVVHNRNPAKVFMGDTGSLALGGALGAVGILSGNLWGLLVVSGIFLAESLSVIAQVSYYKATKGPDGKGKRLFKMAPLHHHLELSGWAETQIVGLFYCINAILAGLAIILS
jgi:phospho-N-acetylmuramoyl-pentapeptide-transferase